MSRSRILKREESFGPLIGAGINVHTECVKAHSHHRFKVSAPILAVVHSDAIQKIGPGNQPAHFEAWLRLPGLAERWKNQPFWMLQGIDFTIQTKEGALTLEKIKNGIEHGL